MPPSEPKKPCDIRFLSLDSSGVSKLVAEEVAHAVIKQLRGRIGHPRLTAVRFIPSTLATWPNGFELIANNTVEFGGAGGKGTGRAELLESVVRIEDDPLGQRLESVEIPRFLAETSAHREVAKG